MLYILSNKLSVDQCIILLSKTTYTVAAGHDSSSDSDDVDSGPPDVVDDYEKVINLNNGGDLVQEDVWDDVRSAACGIM